MWHLIHFVVRPGEAFLGFFCVLTAIVLYPNEEGRIQSKFEDFWIRVDDYQQQALSYHAAFMTQVAKFESHFLDLVFGYKLISVQSVVVSCGCSVVSFSLFASILQWVQPEEIKVDWSIAIIVAPALISTATVIFLQKHRVARRGILTVTSVYVVAILANFAHKAPRHQVTFNGKFFIFLLVGGLCGDIVFIVATRKLLRWAGRMTQSLRVIAIVALNLLLAVVLIGPIFIMINGTVHETIWAISVGSISNIFDGILALLFVFLALILLVHRVLWPLLTRTLFRMTDIGTKGRRAILTTIGIALLSSSVFGGKFPDLLKDLIKHFGG